MKFNITKKANLIIIGLVLIGTLGVLTYAVNNTSKEDKTNEVSLKVEATESHKKIAVNNISKKEKSSETSSKVEVTESPKRIAVKEKGLDEIEQKAEAFVKSQRDKMMTEELAEMYNKSENEIKQLMNENGNWTDVSVKLESELHNKRLTNDEIIKLREKGYGFLDIDKAEQLASKCDKTPEEILEIKGKTDDYNRKKASNGKDLNNNSKSWDEVISILKIDTRPVVEQMGVAKKRIEELRSEGVSDQDIISAATISKKFNKDFEDVMNEFKKGKKSEEIEQDYFCQENNIPDKKEQLKKHGEASEEKALKKDFGVTDSMIEKCHNHGIKGINILTIKNMADKYKISIDKVLDMYESKKDLSLLAKELEGK